jgi:glycosyltransferase involved in cell wall biosynthesis
MPVFSIIVPVFNTENYIRECIESVSAQTFSDYECILINDGSTDGSPAICVEYAVSDKRFMVIHQENMGLSASRNNGVLMAHGEFIIFLDSDDVFFNDYALYNLYNVINENSAEVIYHSNVHFFSDDYVYDNIDAIKTENTCYDIHSFIKEKEHNPHIILTSWSFSLNRKFILRNNLFFKENILHEDNHFAPRLLCAVEKIVINHHLFYGYRRQRQGSISFAMNSVRLLNMIAIINDLLFLRINEKVSYKKEIYALFCRIYWLGILGTLSIFKDNNKDVQNNIIQELKKVSFCVLYQKKPKYILLYLYIKIFGIRNAINIRKYYRFLTKR